MMYQNNNQEIIRKVSRRSLRVNMMRNLFAITAIILTTVLFTSFFTIGMSMVKSFEYSTMRQVGTIAHGGFKYLTSDQFVALSQHKEIKEYGVNVLIGIAENPQLAKRQVQIQYMDDNDAHYSFVTPLLKGAMPQAENEVVLDTITLDLLGLGYDLGQEVTLDYQVNGKKYSKTFILSGYYQGDKVSLASLACVSKKFADKSLTEIDLELSRKTGSMAGLLNMDVMLSKKYNIESKLRSILVDSGFAPKDINIGVNWGYMGSNLFSDPGNYISIIGLLLLIMSSGYLIIYNIFLISVVKDTRFFGLLKTIGTTRKQLKYLITRQAAVLSLFGIPVGLALGYLVGVLLTPLVMSTVSASHSRLSANPTIFIGSAIFSFTTVMISCRKPARIAAAISPIEAVRYTGITSTGRKTVKKSIHGAKLHRMAFANLFRSKSKVFVAIASLSLSIILLNSVYTMVIGLDLDKYLKGMAGSDFTIGDASFYRWRFHDKNPNALTSSLYNEISRLPGITSLDKIYYKQKLMPLSARMEELVRSKMDTVNSMYRPALEEVLRNKEFSIDLYGIDGGSYELLDDYVVDGKIEQELLESGNHIIIRRNPFLGDIYKKGDIVKLSTDRGESKEFTVLAVVDKLPFYLYNGRTTIGGFAAYLPSSGFKQLVPNPSIMTAFFNVEEGNIPDVQHYLQNKVKQIPTLDFRSKTAFEQEYKNMVLTFTSVGYTLSVIISLIGLLNFANVMITGILARRQEFATMQSIGMTAKQLRKMLAAEGLYYALITLAVALALGIPLVYFGISSLTSQMPFFTYRFTIAPILFCIPLLVGIAMLIPVASFGSANKASVVERLREIE